jgi:hypothetical protein
MVVGSVPLIIACGIVCLACAIVIHLVLRIYE